MAAKQLQKRSIKGVQVSDEMTAEKLDDQA